MGLYYELYIATESSVRDVEDALASAPGFQRHDDVFVAPGIQYALAVDLSEAYRRGLAQNWGITPNLWVTFRIFLEEGTSVGCRSVVTASVRILESVPGDAVLLFNDDTLMLRRQKGLLELNSLILPPEFSENLKSNYAYREIE